MSIVPYLSNKDNDTVPYLSKRDNDVVPYLSNRDNDIVPYLSNRDNDVVPYLSNRDNDTVPYLLSIYLSVYFTPWHVPISASRRTRSRYGHSAGFPLCFDFDDVGSAEAESEPTAEVGKG